MRRSFALIRHRRARAVPSVCMLRVRPCASGPPAVASAGMIHSRARHWTGIYAELSKAKLSALVVATTTGGFLFAGAPIAWPALAAVTVGTSLAACSANTFNQTIEHEYDALMVRTKKRPLPTGRISTAHAAMFGVASGVASTALLAAFTNPLTAGLGAANILLYAGVYTPLKRRHKVNTWVGAVVGAIPPVMGWTAAGGDLLCAEAALLSTTLFLWQFPHFFSLAWLAKEDYARGSYQMVPVSDPTGADTAGLLLRYSVYMAPLPFAAYGCGLTTAMFPIESVAINGYMIYLCSQFYIKHTNANAKRVFMCSLWLLPALMGTMLFHKKQWYADEEQEVTKLELGADGLKEGGRGLCIHEALVTKDTSTPESERQACPLNRILAEAPAQRANQRIATVPFAAKANFRN